MFRPIFCRHMPWRTSWEIGWSELAMGSIVPASGAGGLALGAWILHEGGMPGDRIARRSVAFFLIKSSVNFVAVAVLGLALASAVRAAFSPWLTLLPALLSVARDRRGGRHPALPEGPEAPEDAGRLRRWCSAARRSLIGGTGEAIEIVRSRDPSRDRRRGRLLALDNAVLWATFHAFGASSRSRSC